MKNNLKRILLLLPVISVLLVALAVPAFADYSPVTGWSEPLEVWEPFDLVETNWSTGESYTFRIGEPFVITMDEFEREFYFRYCIRVRRENLVSADLAAFVEQFLNGFVVFRLSAGPMPGSNYSTECLGGTSITIMPNDDLGVVAVTDAGFLSSGGNGSTVTPYMYTTEYVDFFVEDYPFPEDFLFADQLEVPVAIEAWQYIPFEVYQIGVDSVSSDSVTSVWTEIMTWITSALNSVMGAFYVDGSLTLLGTLAVIGVSVGICFLLIGLIQRFLHLRG